MYILILYLIFLILFFLNRKKIYKPELTEKFIIDVNALKRQLLSGIQNVVNSARRSITDALNPIINSIRSILNSIMNSFENSVKLIVNNLKSFIQGIINNLKNEINQLVNQIKNSLEDVFKEIEDVMKDTLDALKKGLDSMGDGAKDAFKSLGDSLISIAEQIAEEGAKGIKSITKGLADSFKSILNDQVKSFTKSIEREADKISKDLDKLVNDLENQYKEKKESERKAQQNSMNDCIYNTIKIQYDKSIDAKERLEKMKSEKIKSFDKNIQSKSTSDGYLAAFYNKRKAEYVKHLNSKNSLKLPYIVKDIDKNLERLDILSSQIQEIENNNKFNNNNLDKNNQTTYQNFKNNKQILENRKLISNEIVKMIDVLKLFKTHVDHKKNEFKNLNDDLSKKNKFLKIQIDNAYRRIDEINFKSKVNDCKIWKHNKMIADKQREKSRIRDCKISKYNRCLHDQISLDNYTKNTSQNKELFNELKRKFFGIYYDILDHKWKFGMYDKYNNKIKSYESNKFNEFTHKNHI